MELSGKRDEYSMRKLKRYGAVALALFICLEMICSNGMIAKADYEEPAYTPESDGPVLPPVEEEEENEKVSIEASGRIFSFGHIEQGTECVEYQGVTITNTGDKSIDLDYQLSDAEDAFIMNVPGSLLLAPGQATTLYFKMDGQKQVGYYSATLIVCPLGYISETINIGLSGEIVAKKPYITYMAIQPGSVELSKGSSYQFQAIVRGENNPRTDVSWSVDGAGASTSIDNNGVLRVGADETANRFFVRITSLQDTDCWDMAEVTLRENTYSVVTTSNPAQGGTTGGGGSVTAGSSMELFAAPNNGYRFVNWTCDGKVISNNAKCYLNNIRQNYNLVANFEKVSCYVKVNVTHPEGGDVSPSTYVDYNGSVTLKANAKDRFRLEGWYENGNRISTNTQLVLDRITTDRQITANFVQDVFTVKAQIGIQNSGTVTGEGNYRYGDTVKLTAKPYDGYEFDCWTNNNTVFSKDAELIIKNIDRDINIVAFFKKKNAVVYQITASVDEGQGTISPAGVANVPQGADINYTFAPGKGYTIGSVWVDGTNMGPITSFLFKQNSGNHKIGVRFVKIPEEHTHDEMPSSNHNETNKIETEKHDAILPEYSKEQEETPVVDDYFVSDEIQEDAVDRFLQYTELTGVLQKFNIMPEEALAMIRNGQDIPLLEKSCQEQYLSVTVHNEYGGSLVDQSVGYIASASVPNMQEVVQSVLTEEEKMSVFAGDPVWINLNLFANNKMQTEEDKLMVNRAFKDHVEIGSFFEMVFMKSTSESTDLLTTLPVPAQIVMEVPANLRADGRTFYIMRSHKLPDGSVELSYLENESTDADKIIFRTDRFSSYAIVYQGGKSAAPTQMKLVKWIMLLLVLLIVLTIALGIVIFVQTSHRRKRKHSGR